MRGMFTGLKALAARYALAAVVMLLVGGWGTVVYLRSQVQELRVRADNAEGVVSTVEKGTAASRAADRQLGAKPVDELLCEKGWMTECPTTPGQAAAPYSSPARLFITGLPRQDPPQGARGDPLPSDSPPPPLEGAAAPVFPALSPAPAAQSQAPGGGDTVSPSATSKPARKRRAERRAPRERAWYEEQPWMRPFWLE